MDILQGQYTIDQMKSLYRPLIHAYGENAITPLPYGVSRFIYDIYINGVFIIREFKVWKIGNYSNPYSWMDVAPVIRNYISATFKNGMYPAYIEYQIQYGCWVSSRSRRLRSVKRNCTTDGFYSYCIFRRYIY